MTQKQITWKTALPVIITLLIVAPAMGVDASNPLTAEDLLLLKSSGSARISPDGDHIAYLVNVPRQFNEAAGGAYSELYLMATKTKTIRPFITGKVQINAPQWSPQGDRIAFLTTRGENARSQVWIIPVDGGEAVQVTHSETGVAAFVWHPSGQGIAYTATSPKTKREKDSDKKGFGFIFYEEDWKHRNLYLLDLEPQSEPQQLTESITVWDFEFNPSGTLLAVATSQRNLIDDSYMFQKIQLLDPVTKSLKPLSQNEGKLGNFAFSPDGAYLAYAAALDQKDHAVSQAFVIPLSGGAAVNLTPPQFRGHVNWVGWKNPKTLLFHASEGVWNSLNSVTVTGAGRKTLLHSKNIGVIFSPPDYTADMKHIAFTANSAAFPNEVFYWDGDKAPQRLTKLNPDLETRRLGHQEAYCYQARDGQEIESIIMYPPDYHKASRYPLIVFVHGGPEAHHSNGWETSYGTAGQVYAGKGYVVMYPNYRASTGYGVEFAAAGYGDPAGVEFDDIADGIQDLIDRGIADPQRVGLAGGSYGGYAAAWFATYYTKLVKAVCMFVGISNLISKRGTTDIPYEELYVHSGKKLEEMWQLSLERSPIYWAHQSRTATLIYGGSADTRVHPSQSLELYRRLKMNNHPAVRLVQYPGEGHGNRNWPGRMDVLFRQMAWFDWYVKDAKPLEGSLPALDLGEEYPLKWD